MDERKNDLIIFLKGTEADVESGKQREEEGMEEERARS